MGASMIIQAKRRTPQLFRSTTSGTPTRLSDEVMDDTSGRRSGVDFRRLAPTEPGVHCVPKVPVDFSVEG